MTRVAVAELLAYTGPVFVAALAPLISREPYDRRIVLPLVLALGGTAVIIGLGELSLQGGRSLLGAAMAFCSALTYAALGGRSLNELLAQPAAGELPFGVGLDLAIALPISWLPLIGTKMLQNPPSRLRRGLSSLGENSVVGQSCLAGQPIGFLK